MNILKQIICLASIVIVQIHSRLHIEGNTATYFHRIRPEGKLKNPISESKIWPQEINIEEAAKSVGLSLSQFCKVLEFADQDKVDIKIPLK